MDTVNLIPAGINTGTHIPEGRAGRIRALRRRCRISRQARIALRRVGMRLRAVFMALLVRDMLDKALRLGSILHSLRLATGSSSNSTRSSRSSRSNHNTDNRTATTNTLPPNSKAINRLSAAHRSNTDSTTHTAHHLNSNTQNYPEILTANTSRNSSMANSNSRSSRLVVTDSSKRIRLRRLWDRTLEGNTRTSIRDSIRTKASIHIRDSICIKDRDKGRGSSIRLIILMPLHSSRVRCTAKGTVRGMVNSRPVRAGSQTSDSGLVMWIT